MTINSFSLAAKLSRDNVISVHRSPSSVISYLSETREEPKRELAEKLLRFREQSKIELQKSWDEVESLYKKRANYAKINAQIEKDLQESTEKKEMWRVRCLAAEEAAVQKSKKKALLHLSKTMSPRNLIRSSSNKRLQRIDEAQISESDERISQSSEQRQLSSIICISARPIAHPAYNTTPTQSAGENVAVGAPIATEIGRPTLCSYKKKNQPSDLLLKLSSRDLVIACLRSVSNELQHHFQTVQLEMECLIEAQQIKEKKISDLISRKQLWHDKLSKKVELSNNCVKQRKHAISDTQSCIKELANELENLLGAVKIAEDRGFCLRNSFPNFSPTAVEVPIISTSH